MPGTIRVSVLEAANLPETVEGRTVAVKVAMGKKEFRTEGLAVSGGSSVGAWNADFQFPVLNLKDHLQVIIEDESAGVEITKTEIETPSIVEKGFRDELVPLSDGGALHLRLSFVLSEEERKKIEQMRTLSMRRKMDAEASAKAAVAAVDTGSAPAGPPPAGVGAAVAAAEKAAAGVLPPAGPPKGASVSRSSVGQKVDAAKQEISSGLGASSAGAERLGADASTQAKKLVAFAEEKAQELNGARPKSTKVEAEAGEGAQEGEGGRGGFGRLVTQLIGAAAVITGLVLLWPKESESESEEGEESRPKPIRRSPEYYVVRPGDTLSQIVPGQCYNIESDFYKLNPEICDRNIIYAGQKLRLK